MPVSKTLSQTSTRFIDTEPNIETDLETGGRLAANVFLGASREPVPDAYSQACRGHTAHAYLSSVLPGLLGVAKLQKRLWQPKKTIMRAK